MSQPLRINKPSGPGQELARANQGNKYLFLANGMHGIGENKHSWS